MQGIELQVLGDVVLSRRFVRISVNSSDYSDPFGTILDAFEDWTGQQFESKGREFGTEWDELADSTVEEKARDPRVADPTQPLVRSGALALSFQGGPGHIRDISAEEAAWGSRNENVMWHHGRKRSSSNPVPRRPIFEPQEARRRWMMVVLQRHTFGTGSPEAAPR